MSVSIALPRENLNTGSTSGNNAKSNIINSNSNLAIGSESRNLSNVIKSDKLLSNNQIELLTNGKKLLNNRQNREQLPIFLNKKVYNIKQDSFVEMSSCLTTNNNNNNLVENDGNKSTNMDKTLNASSSDEIRATANTSLNKRFSAIPVPVSRNSELSNNDRKSYLNQANNINNQSISSTIATKKLDEISSQSEFYSTSTKTTAFLAHSPPIMTDVKKRHKRSSSLASSDETRPIFSKSLANKIANARNSFQLRMTKNSNGLKQPVVKSETKNEVFPLQKPNSKLPILSKQTKPANDSTVNASRQKDSLKPIQSSSTVSSISTKSSKLTAIPHQPNSNKTK